jgi:hypothetical protein
MRELNKLHQKILQTFASAQAYVNIKGHYFPILLESIGDESKIDSLDGKRFYVQTYEMKLQGYLVDSEEFEVKPAISRLFVTTEIANKKRKPIARFIKDETQNDKTITCVIQFLPNSPTTLKFNTDNRTIFSTIELKNVMAYTIYKNGSPVSLPFTAESTDEIVVVIVRTNSTELSEITLRGLIIV